MEMVSKLNSFKVISEKKNYIHITYALVDKTFTL